MHLISLELVLMTHFRSAGEVINVIGVEADLKVLHQSINRVVLGLQFLQILIKVALNVKRQFDH